MPIFVFRCSYDSTIRVFDSSSFSYSDSHYVAIMMGIYFAMLMEMSRSGYDLYACSNISGRFDKDDERYVSPHTWFFISQQGRVSDIPTAPPQITAMSEITTPFRNSGVAPSAPTPAPASLLTVELPPSFSSLQIEDQDSDLPTYEEALLLDLNSNQNALVNES